MYSPLTSVPQTSAPVVVLRSVLPAETNLRVNAVMEKAGELEREVEALEKEMVAGCDWSNYGEKITGFAVLDVAAQEALRATVRDRFANYPALHANVLTELPRASAARLVSRLEAAVEEAAEFAAKPSRGGATIEDIVPERVAWKLSRLTSEQISRLSHEPSLSLTQVGLGDLSHETWVLLACALSNVQALDLGENDLSKLSRETWELLAPLFGQVRHLYLGNNGLSDLPFETWELLAPHLGKVRSLHLSANGLSTLPFETWELLAPHLGKVRLLSLGGNELSDLPFETWELLAPHLGRVRSLLLGVNNFSNLPRATWEMFARDFGKVRYLDFDEFDAKIDPAVLAPILSLPQGPEVHF